LIALVEEDGLQTEPLAKEVLSTLITQLRDTQAQIGKLDMRIHAWHRANAISRRLETIPGIGPITASAIAATITDASLFRSGRQLAAWLGLVPRQNSSGGKDRLGHITKKGDGYIRKLLVVGAHAVLRFARGAKTAALRWAAELIARKPYKVAAVALANKMARIAWAILARGEEYRSAAA
jgi:transposase